MNEYTLEQIRLRVFYRSDIRISGLDEPIEAFLWWAAPLEDDMWAIVGLTDSENLQLMTEIDQDWAVRMAIYVGDPWNLITVSPTRLAELQSHLIMAYEKNNEGIKGLGLDEVRKKRSAEDAAAIQKITGDVSMN